MQRSSLACIAWAQADWISDGAEELARRWSPPHTDALLDGHDPEAAARLLWPGLRRAYCLGDRATGEPRRGGRSAPRRAQKLKR